MVFRLNEAFDADIREIGHYQYVHNPPSFIRRITFKFDTKALSHDASSPVGTHHVACLDDFLLILLLGVAALEGRGDGIGI